MGLKNMSISNGDCSASTITVNTPVAFDFVDNGVSIQNGVQLVAPAVEANVRPQMTCKYRPSILKPDGKRTKNKWTISFAIPKVLASGAIEYELIRLERELSPESSHDNGMDLFNLIGAQLLLDTDLDDFWNVGSLT